jgi:plasmid stability protein
MAQLIVRNLQSSLVQRLKQRAKRDSVSMEEEHRRILRAALQEEGTRSFKDFLLSMPNVGDDKDFERVPQPAREVRL